jgi:hypothetical protein
MGTGNYETLKEYNISIGNLLRKEQNHGWNKKAKV